MIQVLIISEKRKKIPNSKEQIVSIQIMKQEDTVHLIHQLKKFNSIKQIVKEIVIEAI